MKIVTVVGARPQFIKAAMVSHKLQNKHEEIIVHTGQHYDYNMSSVFFDELDIPHPNYNLGISGGSHAEMTGKMIIEIERVLKKEQPECVIVYGDTNSTLAAALAAVKLHIPICHVEAGARVGTLTNPEEVNRICTDHMSSILLASTESGIQFLSKEGLSDRACFVGDPMYDAFLTYRNRIKGLNSLESLDGETIDFPETYYYLTCHREENTNDINSLKEILKAMNSLESPTIYPVHPRNRTNALELKKKHSFDNIIMVNPVGYLESIFLVDNAKRIVTDSGGLQREAFFAEKKCVTVFDKIIWPETMIDNRNSLTVPNAERILQELEKEQRIDKTYLPFGDGNSAAKIVNKIEEYFR